MIIKMNLYGLISYKRYILRPVSYFITKSFVRFTFFITFALVYL